MAAVILKLKAHTKKESPSFANSTHQVARHVQSQSWLDPYIADEIQWYTYAIPVSKSPKIYL